MSREKRFRVAIIGAGRFGARRATAVAKVDKSEIVLVVDQVPEVAKSLANTLGCSQATNWEQAVAREDIDIVVVATSTQFHSAVTNHALQAGKHVLCEKPFGRSVDDIRSCVAEAAARGLALKVGYNHRFHPAIAKAHELFKEGAIGEIQFMRCLYGHGGREGYEREWRAGEGQLLDQGVHALDLFHWFLGDFEETKAFTATAYWDIAPADDNVFALMRTKQNQIATLHASWTNWKNVFALEIFGKTGSLTITGLGGHYGQERLCWGVRHQLGTRPEERWFEYDGPDNSLEEEWKIFVDCIAKNQPPPSSGEESLKILQLVESIYKAARHAQGVFIPRDVGGMISSNAAV